jgi:hypothetical protein
MRERRGRARGDKFSPLCARNRTRAIPLEVGPSGLMGLLGSHKLFRPAGEIRGTKFQHPGSGEPDDSPWLRLRREILGLTSTLLAAVILLNLPGSAAMAMTLTSPAFEQGGQIPSKYTCEGDDISPPLAWNGVPEGTKSLVLIIDDPDAPDPKAPQLLNLPSTPIEARTPLPGFGRNPTTRQEGLGAEPRLRSRNAGLTAEFGKSVVSDRGESAEKMLCISSGL